MKRSTTIIKKTAHREEIAAPVRRAGNIYGRPADRKFHLVNALRQQIIEGEFAPGSRLPTRVEIEQSSGMSSDTVQSALSDLRRDGFIETRGRNGTFVATQLPHLTRYALAFPLSHEATGWGMYWTALEKEAKGIAEAYGREITVYYDVDTSKSSNDYQRLYDEAVAHRIAGIILVNSPSHVMDTPILNEPGIPRVAIAPPTERSQYQVDFPLVNTDIHSFYSRALRELAERGCKRVACLSSATLPPGEIEEFCRIQAKALGLETHPYWWQRVSLEHAYTSQRIVQLMLHEHQHERPDGFIIADDNMVNDATAGMIAAGVKTGELEIIAHCNFPWTPTSQLPVHWLGYDIRTVLEKCIQSIDDQRANRPTKPMHMVEAVFEWELDSKNGSN